MQRFEIRFFRGRVFTGTRHKSTRHSAEHTFDRPSDYGPTEPRCSNPGTRTHRAGESAAELQIVTFPELRICGSAARCNVYAPCCCARGNPAYSAVGEPHAVFLNPEQTGRAFYY